MEDVRTSGRNVPAVPGQKSLTQEQIAELIRLALRQPAYAYAPYSGFFVGAALLAADGRVFTGCNIENASFSATNCAERTAFFKAVSEGVTAFSAICIVGGTGGVVTDFTPPCGVCRQVMAEFCDPDMFLVILAVSCEEYQILTLRQLLPLSFGPENLSAHGGGDAAG